MHFKMANYIRVGLATNKFYGTYAVTPYMLVSVRYASLTHPTDRGFA
jgi:hypothetical protein